MIGNKQKNENPNNGLHNALASGTTVKGDINTETDFRLDGVVDGNIVCNGKIVIGDKGGATGDIHALNAEVSGVINGSLFIKGKLILKASADIKGNIEAENLEIEPNAKFNGTCKMLSKKEA